MKTNRLLMWLVLMVVLAGCTTTIFRLPGGGLVVQVVGYPTVVPHTTNTLSPSLTAATTSTATIPRIDPTPTQGEPIPSVTPTWSSCEAGNYYVRVTATRLNVRLQTTANSQDATQQKVIGSVPENALLEVDACLLDFTPGGWLPVMTDGGLQGIVHSGYVRVSNLRN